MEEKTEVTRDISNADILKAMMGFKEDVSKNIGRLEDKMDMKLSSTAAAIL